MSGPRAVAFGEVLFDRIEGDDYLGGAPLNMAWYLAQLGVPVAMLSAVGRDDVGAAAHRAIDAVDMIDWVADSAEPTGITDVQVVDGEPQFHIREDAAWRSIPMPDELTDDIELVYFGTVAQCTATNRATLAKLTANAPRYRLYDANLRPGYDADDLILDSLRLANVVKLNDQEWSRVSRLTGAADPDELSDRFQVEVLAITRGPNGAELFASGRRHAAVAEGVEVVDTVGAGDAFSAVLAAGMLMNLDFAQILPAACRFAAYTVQHRGGQVPLPAELRKLSLL